MRFLVLLVSVHSLIIGLLLYLFEGRLFAMFGWKPDCNQFLFHQVGIFHVVLSLIYAIEYLCYRRVTSILIAKGAAFVFLMIEYFFLTPETPILIAGIGDGCIGGVVAIGFVKMLRKGDSSTP